MEEKELTVIIPSDLSKMKNWQKVVLVEASPFDKIWGIGMRACKAAEDHNNWKGRNQLGYTLTRVKKAIIADEILANDSQ